MVCLDIAFQLTNDLISPAHVIRSFLFFYNCSTDICTCQCTKTGRHNGRPYIIINYSAAFSCLARCMVTSAQRWAAIRSKVG